MSRKSKKKRIGLHEIRSLLRSRGYRDEDIKEFEGFFMVRVMGVLGEKIVESVAEKDMERFREIIKSGDEDKFRKFFEKYSSNKEEVERKLEEAKVEMYTGLFRVLLLGADEEEKKKIMAVLEE